MKFKIGDRIQTDSSSKWANEHTDRKLLITKINTDTYTIKAIDNKAELTIHYFPIILEKYATKIRSINYND